MHKRPKVHVQIEMQDGSFKDVFTLSTGYSICNPVIDFDSINTSQELKQPYPYKEDSIEVWHVELLGDGSVAIYDENNRNITNIITATHDTTQAKINNYIDAEKQALHEKDSNVRFNTNVIVYAYFGDCIHATHMSHWEIDTVTNKVYLVCMNEKIKIRFTVHSDEFNKTWFISKEQARQALTDTLMKNLEAEESLLFDSV